MLRGELRVVDLDPARGSEANKSRPAVIVSNDGANATASQLGRGIIGEGAAGICGQELGE